MVLPGIQALFGFQLIATFNETFARKLSPSEQRLHLLSIVLVATAVVLIMTPASYHRLSGAREVTETFIRISTRLLLASMAPLAFGLCIEFYLIARLILGGAFPAAILSIALLMLFVILWIVFPWAHVRRGSAR